MTSYPASFTHDDLEGNLYYFAPENRPAGPYTQRQVNAIVDVAADGTLAGVELIDRMPSLPDQGEMTLFEQMHNLLKFWHCVDFESSSEHDGLLLDDNIRDTSVLLEKLKNAGY